MMPNRTYGFNEIFMIPLDSFIENFTKFFKTDRKAEVRLPHGMCGTRSDGHHSHQPVKSVDQVSACEEENTFNYFFFGDLLADER